MHDRPALVIHGHFYQPPRENPWTGIVDREPSAAPSHDWNERIYHECYRPNGWARIFDERGFVEDIVNNYRHLSFNFGPTLMSWLEQHHPRGFRRVLDADRDSLRERGFGNAIAQGYNHAILPLCNERDLRTQIRWGLAEFRHRYGRDAEALWMPETACDDRTLGALIDAGLRYAILAPGQAAMVKINDVWHDVSDGSIDPRRPYRYLHRDGSGRSIAVFFYDGALSRAVAFEGALSSSQALVERFERAADGPGSIVQVVTDGESYGHHFKFGDRCLAHALETEAPKRGFWVTNYATYLEHHPPVREVKLANGPDGLGTSWSCAHGVGRWFRDCGCHTGGEAGWNQAWRGPLRDALNHLRDRAAVIYEDQMASMVVRPWEVRDEYIALLVDRAADRGQFFERHGGRRLDSATQEKALRLLEAQRSAMLMYTSCGWFFNELSGIETVQVMRYAGRLVDQLRELGHGGLEAELLEGLAEAKSNLASQGTGADIYRREVRPAATSPERLAAHVSMAGMITDLPPSGELAEHRYTRSDEQLERRGRVTLSVQRVTLEHLPTGALADYAASAFHFGGVEVHCVLRPYGSDESYRSAASRLVRAAASGSLLTLLRVAEETFGPTSYGLEAVLPSAREATSRAMFEELRGRYAAYYEAMYQDARIYVAQFERADLPLPRELKSAVEVALAYAFDQALATAPTSGFDRSHYERALLIAAEAERHGCTLRRDDARHHFERLLERLVQGVVAGDADVSHAGTGPVPAVESLLATAVDLGLDLDLQKAEELLIAGLRGDLQATPPIRALMQRLRLSPTLFQH
ncbi:MAG: DUF3536 domain-containing protein [Myxococcales bacterium]|nr:DUF3536 domain-containing protein [Myxococcales bacterium]